MSSGIYMDGITLPQAGILRPGARAETGRVLLTNTIFSETLSGTRLPLRQQSALLCTPPS